MSLSIHDGFAERFIGKMGFDVDECELIKAKLEEHKSNTCFKEILSDFKKGEVTYRQAIEKVKDYSDINGYESQLLYLLFLIDNMQIAYEKYLKKGIPEKVIVDTLRDIKIKVEECKRVEHVFGISRPGFFGLILNGSLFQLGRFQYTLETFSQELYEKNGILLKKGDPVVGLHIPESSEPMDDAARKKSYELAYAFFEEYYPEYLVGGYLPIVCSTWLFWDKHRDFLGENSSIVRFMDEFDMLKSYERERVTAPWWIFGCGLKDDVTQYPQNTRLQRAYVNWMLEGNKVGSALGVRLQGEI